MWVGFLISRLANAKDQSELELKKSATGGKRGKCHVMSHNAIGFTNLIGRDGSAVLIGLGTLQENQSLEGRNRQLSLV